MAAHRRGGVGGLDPIRLPACAYFRRRQHAAGIYRLAAARSYIWIGGGPAGVPTLEHAGVLPTYLRRQVDADLEIDGSEGSKFRQIKALARSFQQLSSATATTYP